jgi:hypothetical protein
MKSILIVLLAMGVLAVGCYHPLAPTPPLTPYSNIDYSPSRLNFNATEGGANPSSQTLAIWDSGGGTLSWSLTDDAVWINLIPTSGSSSDRTNIVTVSVNISGMTAGTHTATIVISAPDATNSPITVPVTLIINQAKVEEPGRYYNKDKGFSIKFPNGWEKREGYMGLTVIALSPQESPSDQFRENVNIVDEELPETMSLETYFQINLDNMPKLLTNFQAYESGRLTLGNADSRWLIYGYRMGTTSIKGLVYVLVKGNRGYAITGTATSGSFANYRSIFEETSQSFSFE